MSKRLPTTAISYESDKALKLRVVIALETIARRLGAIEERLLHVVDGNDSSIRMKDIERAKVYQTHLGKELREK
jgi:hypothetical protein